MMRIPLWEWEVVEGPAYRRCGVSRTPYGAMKALSLALVRARVHAVGQVTPVILVDAASGPPFYLHGMPERIAEYDDGIITWVKGTSSRRPEVMR